MKLAGSVAIVTGGSRGIGKAIAVRLAQEGASVVLAARNSVELDLVKDEITGAGGKALSIPTDLREATQISNLIGESLKRLGRIDVLVNNAGIGYFKKVLDLSLEEFDAMWSVNMRAVFLATQSVLPHMIEQGRGEIVNIASLAGKNTFIGGAGYAATKWALRGFAGSLMLEVRESNIRVSTIFPGSVDTTFFSKNMRGEKITQPEDIAEAVAFVLCAPRRSMFSEIDVRPSNPK